MILKRLGISDISVHNIFVINNSYYSLNLFILIVLLLIYCIRKLINIINLYNILCFIKF